jgi:hypothetical protein
MNVDVAAALVPFRTAVRVDPSRHRGRAGLCLIGDKEAFPLCDFLGVQQLCRACWFGVELSSRSPVGFFGRVFTNLTESESRILGAWDP